MAKKNKKEVVKETTDKKIEQPIEEKVEQKIDESKFDSARDDSIFKVDLSKPPPTQESEKVEKQPTKEEEVVVVNEEPKEEVKEEIVKEEQEEIPIVQEITEEEVNEVQEEVEEAITEAEATGKPLPEQLQKVVEFMSETGGDLNDYVNLNRDISKMDNSDILDEYYKTTKPHLTAEERNFLLEESFGFDEEVDDTREIRKKKIALKEQVAEAKAHLDRQKSKYYEEIKAGSGLTPEAKKAMDFFNRYNKENKEQEKRTQKQKHTFLKKTDGVFNEKFKGFDYEVGDKKFRFNIKDVNKVKTTQSDINNFVNKFVGEDKTSIEDAKGYHKSLFTAMNADAIASHFYEQGKADAIKDRVAKDKNINLDPRQTHSETNIGGVKYRVLGDSTTDMKNRSFKIRKKN
jgi:hypothetical protein